MDEDENKKSARGGVIANFNNFLQFMQIKSNKSTNLNQIYKITKFSLTSNKTQRSENCEWHLELKCVCYEIIDFSLLYKN